MNRNAVLIYWEAKCCKDVNFPNALTIKFLTEFGGVNITTTTTAIEYCCCCYFGDA